MPRKTPETKPKSKGLHPSIIVAVITLIGTIVTALLSASSTAKTVPGFLLVLGSVLFIGSILGLGVSNKTTSRNMPNLKIATWTILIISLLTITSSAVIYFTVPADKIPPLGYQTPTATPTNTATLTPTPSLTLTTASPTAWLLENSTLIAPNNTLCTITLSDYKEVDIENVKRVRFVVGERNNYCSWVIPLNGYDASRKKEIIFWVRGERGGEQYQIGIKDKFTPQGKEPKVFQTAEWNWTQVIIPLDSFKYQDLSFLENFSLSFNNAGSGTIYISQLIFVP
jgi:hypothetical protein